MRSKTRCAGGIRRARTSARRTLPPFATDWNNAPAHTPEKNSGRGGTSNKRRPENPCRNSFPVYALARYSNQSRREIGKHTSELQSPDHLVCRLLLEKKKQ